VSWLARLVLLPQRSRPQAERGRADARTLLPQCRLARRSHLPSPRKCPATPWSGTWEAATAIGPQSNTSRALSRRLVAEMAVLSTSRFRGLTALARRWFDGAKCTVEHARLRR
jgi:hypothetical protein